MFRIEYRRPMEAEKKVLSTAIEWLDAALANVDGDAVLTSPYLSFEVCKRLAMAAEESSTSWQLVTDLNPSAVANGYLTARGLRLLLDAGVGVRHVNRLHAKFFIIGTQAMLGSANLTGAGLGATTSPNRELGIELSPDHAAQALATIASWPSRSVSYSDLDQLLEDSHKLTRHDEHVATDDLTPASALHLAEQLLTDARDPQRSLWLKLEYGEPKLNGWAQQSWFASPKKGRPGFRPGDLVFICAKDTRDCYAVVEVASAAEFQPPDYAEWNAGDPEALSRWPWINRTVPRLVPDHLMELKLSELGVSGQALQNGHVRMDLDQFTAGVRALARLASG